MGSQLQNNSVKPGFERLTGLCADQVLGKSLEILFPDSQKEESMALIRRTASGERWEVVEILINYYLRNNRIKVICDFQSPEPMICGECQELRQLFINLFTNATDAMPQGGTLTIQVNEVHDETDWVAIHIKDTGIGIKPAILPKVTEPFYSTKPDGKGTGLGLPICCRIVSEHHGVMNITSNVEEGTTVSIKIPRIIKEANSMSID
jgi:signal transduction histidine kinase